MGGLLLGILLARPIASLVADHFGWRAVFGAAAVVTIAIR
ncbi:major facilitator transporter, partial [Pseudomonas savastanoi pv. glycinea str. race 4]